MVNYFPTYFTNKIIPVFIFSLVIISGIFFSKMLPFIWIFSGLIEVTSFFYFSNTITKKWGILPEKIYKKKLFYTSLWIRIVYVVFSYFFYSIMTGKPFEFSAADSSGYHETAIWFADILRKGYFNGYMFYVGGHISDSGYPTYLSIIYLIFGSSIIIVRLFKAVWGAATCLLIYKYAERNFGESVGRMAGIFCMLFPNLIFYCGLHLKEIEMTFLIVLFIERTDYLLKVRNYNFKNIIIVLVLALSLFFFRTVLGITAFISIITAIVFTSKRLFGLNRKISISVWILALFFILLTTPIKDEILTYWEGRTTNLELSLEEKTNREHGNSFAQYASTSLFIPFMPIAPFPTLINVPWQQNQMSLAGGYFVKNIIGFFAIMGFILLIKRKQVLNNSLIVFFLASYLGILTVSRFAIVERFHMPMIPLLIVFASLGITNVKMNKKYFIPYLILLTVIIIGWNWIKVAGRI